MPTAIPMTTITGPLNAPTHATTCVPSGNADIVEYKNGSWQQSRSCSVNATTSTSGASIIFISTAQAEKSTETIQLHDLFAAEHNVPKWFWKEETQNASGYFYGSQTGSKYTTLSHFLIKYATGANQQYGLDKAYDWYKQSFLTVYEEGKRAMLICIDVAPKFRTTICQLVQAHPVADLLASPFSLYGCILEHIVSLYDTAIWDFRNFVRAQEKKRPTIAEPDPDYVAMHELARHVMHSSEVSETALNVIDSILEDLDRYQKKNTVQTNDLDPSPEIRRQRSLLKGMHLRSRALEERLRNEINLAFHISTQADSLVQAKIAAASQRDSNATRTISILGLVFLPGTFISAIFSMSFFNYTQATDTSPASWAMSSKFWIYWVVAIPITLLTILTWWYWQREAEKIAPKPPQLARSHTIQIDQHPKSTFTY